MQRATSDSNQSYRRRFSRRRPRLRDACPALGADQCEPDDEHQPNCRRAAIPERDRQPRQQQRTERPQRDHVGGELRLEQHRKQRGLQQRRDRERDGRRTDRPPRPCDHRQRRRHADRHRPGADANHRQPAQRAQRPADRERTVAVQRVVDVEARVEEVEAAGRHPHLSGEVLPVRGDERRPGNPRQREAGEQEPTGTLAQQLAAAPDHQQAEQDRQPESTVEMRQARQPGEDPGEQIQCIASITFRAIEQAIRRGEPSRARTPVDKRRHTPRPRARACCSAPTRPAR